MQETGGTDPYTIPSTIPSSRGMVQKGNINIYHRPVVHNPDGTISTVRSAVIGTEKGFYVIPTVIRINGKWGIGTAQQSIAYWRRTGQHLGLFKTEQQANKYSIDLHKYLAIMMHLTP